MPQNRYGMGGGGRRLRQRWPRRPLRHRLRRQHALSQQRRRARSATSPQRAGVGGRGLERERRLLRLRQRRPPRSVRHPLRRVELRDERLLRREEARLPRLLPPRQLRGGQTSSSATTATGPSPTSPRRRVSPAPAARGSASRSPTTTTTASRTSTWPTIRFSRFLFRNNGDGTFAEDGLLAGVGFNEDGKTFAGMGVDFADYDNDGRPDVIVTDLSNERYRLFRQNGDGSFRDATNSSGVGARHPRRSPAGARASSTTTTTAGRTSSSPRDT